MILSVGETRVPGRAAIFRVLLCGALFYFFANVQRVAIPGAVFDQLQLRTGMGASGIAALGAVFMYVYAAAQLFVGVLVDRYGGVRTIMVGGLVFCSGSLWFTLATRPEWMYCARALTGLGAAAFYLSMVRETIRTFPGCYNVMISIVVMIGYAGGIVANAPFSGCVTIFGLDGVLLTVAVLSAVVFCGFVLASVALPPVPVDRRATLHPRRFIAVLKLRHNRNLFWFYGVNWGLYYVIQTVVGKKFLEDFCGIPAGRAALTLSVMGTISALAGFSFAVISRCCGDRRRIFCRFAGLMSPLVFFGFTLLVLLNIRSSWLAALFCLLAMTASISSIVIPLIKETNRPKLVGTAVSMMNFISYLAVAVFGNAAGLLLGCFTPGIVNGVEVYPRVAWLGMFSAMAAASLVVCRESFQMRETRGRHISVE